MGYHWDFTFLWSYRGLLASGLIYTLLFTLVTMVGGVAIGLALGVARYASGPVIGFPATVFVQLFRCTPLLVQLIWFYYAFPVIIGVEMTAPVAGALALTLYASAFYAEIFRAGIQAVDMGQWEAGRAIGMRRARIFRRIIFPQAVRIMVPALISQFIMQLKNTSLLSTIAVGELLYQGSLITATTYRPLDVYTAVALIYFGILFPLTFAAEHAEQRLKQRQAG